MMRFGKVLSVSNFSNIRKTNRHLSRKYRNFEFCLSSDLESRELLAVTLIPMGPTPIEQGQVEGMSSQKNPVAGAIQAVLTHPTDADTIWAGTTNGGIWKTTNAKSAFPTWKPLTDHLPNGSIGSMVFDAADASSQTIIAGLGAVSSFGRTSSALEGLLKSTDGGTSWTQLGTTSLNGQFITGIGANGNTLITVSHPYYATPSVSRSTDGGLSWTKISGTAGLPNAGGYDLKIDPTNTSRYFLGTASGIYRTTDSGVTWTNVTPAGVPLGSTTDNVKFSIGKNTGVIFAAFMTNGRLAAMTRSADAGATWQNLDIPEVIESRVNTVTNATNASPIVITSATSHGQRTGDRVFVNNVGGNTAANGYWTITVINGTQFSLNGSVGNGAYTSGGTWQAVQGLQPNEHPGSQGDLHFSIVADPSNPNLVYVGGDRQPLNNGAGSGSFPNSIGATNYTGRLFRGNSAQASGSQWTPITNNYADADGSGPLAGTSPHADSRGMAFDADGNIVEVDDGGIYKRSNPTSSTGVWSSLNGSIQIQEIYPGGLGYDPLNDILIAGAQDVGCSQQKSKGSMTWETLNQGDGSQIMAADLGNGTSVRYHTYQNLGGGYLFRKYYNSANNLVNSGSAGLYVSGLGPMWQVDSTFQFVTPIELNSQNPLRMVIGTGYLYESSDGGDTLNRLATLGYTRSLAYGGPGNANLLWVGGNSPSTALMVRTSGTGAPTLVSTFPGYYTKDIAVGSISASSAYVIDYYGTIYRTTDAGATAGNWTDITGNYATIDKGALSICTVKIGSGATLRDLVVVGGTRGVFAMDSAKPGIWFRVGAELPSVLVKDVRYSTADDLLIVGSQGRGAWTSANFVAALTSDTTGPTANFTAIVPNPSPTAIDNIEIVFSEPVNGLDLSDFALRRGSTTVPLNPALQTLTTTDFKIWRIGNLAPLTTTNGTYTIDLVSASSNIADGNGNAIQGSATTSFVITTNSIMGRVFDTDTTQGISRVRVYNDANNNGKFDGSVVAATSPTTRIRILDNKTVTKTVTVPKASQPIYGMTVTVDMRHTHLGDLDVTLISPGNVRVKLLSRDGGMGQHLINTTFADYADTSIPTGQYGNTGYYLPNQSLNAFNGLAVDGVWTLEITDYAYGDVGYLNSFSLNMTSTAEANVFTNSSGNYQFNNVAAGNYRIRIEKSVPSWTIVAPSTQLYNYTHITGSGISGLDFAIRRNLSGATRGLVLLPAGNSSITAAPASSVVAQNTAAINFPNQSVPSATKMASIGKKRRMK